ncbi:hypothetical protein ACFV0O_19675 [Kitasatospora sp. NPDC059577]|uniref:hypothetical protein n=1 Tax=unclassified Kitasatospora TaxID=2633591 RepID=UPI0036BDFF7F
MNEQGREGSTERGQDQGQDQGGNHGQGGNRGREQDREPQPKPAGKAGLVFRDPLDQQSRDDTDAGWGDRSGAGGSGGRGLDWYLSQRPPHHG